MKTRANMELNSTLFRYTSFFTVIQFWHRVKTRDRSLNFTKTGFGQYAQTFIIPVLFLPLTISLSFTDPRSDLALLFAWNIFVLVDGPSTHKLYTSWPAGPCCCRSVHLYLSSWHLFRASCRSKCKLTTNNLLNLLLLYPSLWISEGEFIDRL